MKAEKTDSLAASLKAASAGVRKRDVIHVDPAPRVAAVAQAPTPEQMRHGDYVEDEVCDRSADGRQIKLGRAYRRVPHFETLAKQSSRIDDAGLAALRWYRAAHDAQDASPTRCALNQEARGAGLPLGIPFSIAGMMLEDLHGGTLCDIIERAIGGQLLGTLRAVALDDQSFSAIAIARFGSRKVGWIDQERSRGTDRKGNRLAYVDKVAPLSGRHRDIIAQEFDAALARLVAVHAPYVTTRQAHPFRLTAPTLTAAEAELTALVTVGTAASEPLPAVDPAFLDEAGRMRPMAEIADIIRTRV